MRIIHSTNELSGIIALNQTYVKELAFRIKHVNQHFVTLVKYPRDYSFAMRMKNYHHSFQEAVNECRSFYKKIMNESNNPGQLDYTKMKDWRAFRDLHHPEKSCILLVYGNDLPPQEGKRWPVEIMECDLMDDDDIIPIILGYTFD